MLDKVKKFVQKSFGKKGLPHFERTLYWAKKLNPNVDESVLIAAYAHDIARAFRKKSSEETFANCELNDAHVLKEHQEKGAKIIEEFLGREKFDKKNIKRISNMISKHEYGGDEESNLIKDADSISYLENVAYKHVRQLSPLLGKDKMKRKVDWMFNRISSSKAKEAAKPIYEKVLDNWRRNVTRK